ncbi:hypothetical protein [Psychrobacter jeotgali]|uniref:hypothetical protein n=1 Tax=Psychrobacter jeotgali TaxID=179010 RepID=UPI00191B46BF|nr:hypothetical protein [Psychrobacter jeotgali]
MFEEVLTPKDSAFFDWDYTADECIEQLEQLAYSDDTDLSFICEWVALSLETQSVAYYKQDYEAVANLLDAIASIVLLIDIKRLSEYPFLLHTGLRALMSQTHQKVNTSYLLALYRLLPSIPDPKTLDIYVMFQCHFGFTHVLSRWRENFNHHANENGWSDYNAVQLDVGINLIKTRIHKEPALLTKLDEQFSDYILALEDSPLAAEWFPWLPWFISQEM